MWGRASWLQEVARTWDEGTDIVSIGLVSVLKEGYYWLGLDFKCDLFTNFL